MIFKILTHSLNWDSSFINSWFLLLCLTCSFSTLPFLHSKFCFYFKLISSLGTIRPLKTGFSAFFTFSKHISDFIILDFLLIPLVFVLSPTKHFRSLTFAFAPSLYFPHSRQFSWKSSSTFHQGWYLQTCLAESLISQIAFLLFHFAFNFLATARWCCFINETYSD